VTGQPLLERAVARALRLGLPAALHPSSLAQAVVDAVLGAAVGGEAPNRIIVRLHPGDARALAPVLGDLEAAICESLDAACTAAGLRPFAPWQLAFVPSAACEPGQPVIRADFHDPAAPASVATVRETVRLRRLEGLRLRLAGGAAVPLTHTPFVLGRGADCDLVVPDLTVSRRHAEIRHGPGGGLEIRDLGSRNGTFVNGERVAAAPVAPGDTLALGSAELRLEAAP
jgi:hypothetical protein